ncbi:hypothetical protein PVAND_016164 [Polypedilum vanderplanki]|uniref:Ionotropic receptor n=1 Tax=Polypedilum vanderplanki TaxID=319348 RepID=A0A9J6BF16_POLVA|nr:hypothetical protein PVAND_016164 [Polypedilum vanderplanki]
MTTFCNSLALNLKIIQSMQNDEVNSLSKVLSDVLHEFFIVNGIKFDIVIYGQTTNHINEVINEVTKKLSKKIAVDIVLIQNVVNWSHELNRPAIILTKTEKHLQYFQNRSTHSHLYDRKLTNIVPLKLKFLVYVEEIKSLNQVEKLISNVFLSPLPDLRYFEIFIINDQKLINLVANVLYSEEKCGKFHLKTLNSFQIETQKWNKKLQNFNHFDNFHACMVTIFFNFDVLWYFDDHKAFLKSENKELDIATQNLSHRGLTYEIFNTLAIKRNFTRHYMMLNENINLNKTGTKNFIRNDNQGIYIISRGMLQYNIYFFISVGFTKIDGYYLISQNDLYTNYEKILMPFDFHTWILLSITILMTILIFYCSYLFLQLFQNISNGVETKYPLYDILSIIFGISIQNIPGKFFSRLMIALCLWYCLIFRTCYQSMLFEFMTSDMRKPMPASIEDLIKYDYTIVLKKRIDNTYESVNDEVINGRERPNVKVVNFAEFLKLYKKALKGKQKEKYAFLASEFDHAFLNATFKDSLTIMHNEKAPQMYAYHATTNNILFVDFNEILKQLIPTGIAKHASDYGLWFLHRPISLDFIDPKRVLSMTDLEFGFVLWIFSLLLPITCFLCEILSVKIKKSIEILKKFVQIRIIVTVMRLMTQRL